MASILARNLTAFTRTAIVPRVATSVKFYSDKIPPYYDPAEGKIASKEVSMPDEMGGAVGIERWELLQIAKGNKDPFVMNAVKMEPGTKDKPTIIPTVAEMRTIGCICEEDSVVIRYTKLHVGETKRCSCGNFFKLVHASNLVDQQQH